MTFASLKKELLLTQVGSNGEHRRAETPMIPQHVNGERLGHEHLVQPCAYIVHLQRSAGPRLFHASVVHACRHAGGSH
jgi:hypothetical protein